jgi:hypothetical protein
MLGPGVYWTGLDWSGMGVLLLLLLSTKRIDMTIQSINQSTILMNMPFHAMPCQLSASLEFFPRGSSCCISIFTSPFLLCSELFRKVIGMLGLFGLFDQ